MTTIDLRDDAMAALNAAVHEAEARCDRRLRGRRARQELIEARAEEADALAAMGFGDYGEYLIAHRRQRASADS